MISPTIGRKVWFWPTAPQAGDQPIDANVVYVHGDRLINIAGFDHQGAPYAHTSVPLVQEGDEKPVSFYCEWMPYQVGQAQKDSAAKGLA